MAREGEQRLKIIIFRHFILLFVTTPGTAMRYRIVFPLIQEQHYRFHQRAARGRSIPREDIHVLAPQTFRAMIRIAIPADHGIAPFTSKVLLTPLKYPVLRESH